MSAAGAAMTKIKDGSPEIEMMGVDKEGIRFRWTSFPDEWRGRCDRPIVGHSGLFLRSWLFPEVPLYNDDVWAPGSINDDNVCLWPNSRPLSNLLSLLEEARKRYESEQAQKPRAVSVHDATIERLNNRIADLEADAHDAAIERLNNRIADLEADIRNMSDEKDCRIKELEKCVKRISICWRKYII